MFVQQFWCAVCWSGGQSRYITFIPSPTQTKDKKENRNGVAAFLAFAFRFLLGLLYD